MEISLKTIHAKLPLKICMSSIREIADFRQNHQCRLELVRNRTVTKHEDERQSITKYDTYRAQKVVNCTWTNRGPYREDH